ncbi:putative F-box protein At4g21240 [Capsella rubella]|uniref:putative F-box protein At4g21240 n=1 Tax=Capsella rubella TaxID=81985 RepID=UPI000CD576D8|nr:putative F-box protein At4g21240 [Capsella rubella]
MGKGEEKIQVIHRITKSSSACFHGDNKYDNNEVFSGRDHIPLDLTREILIRLPAKSISRFRCVSKLWLSITTQQDFIDSFAVLQSSIPPQSLLLTFTREDNMKTHVFCMLPFRKNSTSYNDVNKFDMTPPIKDCRYSCSNISINGLITFNTKTETVIWNPTTKEHITVLKPKTPKPVRSFLGYDPRENTYKLLTMSCSYIRQEKYQDPQILTLGSQESWRVIKNSPDHQPRSDYYCINGVVYYKADISFAEDRDDHRIVPALSKAFLAMRLKDIIMSFGVRMLKNKSGQKMNLFYLCL